MRSLRNTENLKACLLSVVENDPLSALRKAKATIVATAGVPVSHQLVRQVLKALGYSRKKVFYFSLQSTPTDFAATVFLECRDWYEAPQRRFIISIDVTSL
jgi:bifunctional DNase/RNase